MRITGKQPVRTQPSRAPGHAGPLRNRSLTRAVLVLLAVFVAGGGAGLGIARLRDRTVGAVAAVNGVPVSASDFLHRLQRGDGHRILTQMIEEEINIQLARKTGVFPTDEQIEAKLAEARRQPDYAANLTATHQTEEDARRNILLNLTQSNIITKGVSVTDADVRAVYAAGSNKKNPKARYYTPETFNIAVIVTRREEDARRALSELSRSVPFDEVARAYSNDRSALAGGMLAPVQRGRSRFDRLPGLQAPLFRMKQGGQIGPMKIGANWWIVRCLRHTAEIVVPFEKVRDECRTGAMLARGLAVNGARIAADLQSFKKSAKIRTYWKEYQDIMK